MPMGYEFGAKTRMDVVKGTVDDVDKPQWDLTEWITDVNAFKLSMPVLCEEGTWNALYPFDRDLLFLEKRSDKGEASIFLCINKNKQNGRGVSREEFPNVIKSCATILRPTTGNFDGSAVPGAVDLGPAEIALLY
jgi:starch synthase (maltosyl-transferring)